MRIWDFWAVFLRFFCETDHVSGYVGFSAGWFYGFLFFKFGDAGFCGLASFLKTAKVLSWFFHGRGGFWEICLIFGKNQAMSFDGFLRQAGFYAYLRINMSLCFR